MEIALVLVQPLFYLNVLLLATVAAALCLLAIWAGASRRHWFLRASGLLAGLLALWPVGAYAPLVLFLFVTPAIAGCILAARWWQSRRAPGVEESGREPAFWRYRLHDLFLATVVVAVLVLVLGQLIRQPMALVWGELALTGTTMVAISVVAYAFVTARRWKLWLLLGLFAINVTATGLHAWLLDDWREVDLALELQQDLDGPNTDWEIGIAAFVAFFVLSLLVTLPLTLVNIAAPGAQALLANRRHRARVHAARVGLALLAVAVLAPLCLIYAHMLKGTPRPADQFPASNSFPRVAALVKRAKELNPNRLPLEQLRQQPGGAEASAELEQLYRELLVVLEKPGYTVIEYGPDADSAAERDVRSCARLAEVWDEEMKRASAAGRYDEGAEFALGCVRLGNMARRGSLTIQALVAYVIGSMGRDYLTANIDTISVAEARRVIGVLDAVEASWEPVSITLARERAWAHSYYGWTFRYAEALGRLINRDVLDEENQIIANAGNGHLAAHRLIKTRLAVRLFREDRGRLPENLGELVPEFLPAAPIDPFSGQPLIYRREGEAYSLYSVGPNGRDDGGRFGNWPQIVTAPDGLDFDLETRSRP